MNHKTYILAIETSCDETAAAVLVGNPQAKSPMYHLLSNVVKSQIKDHAAWGGVVPELAARLHTEYISPVVNKALTDSKISLDKINYIAVTNGPGLIGSLLVGVEFAKGLSMSTGIPLLPTNHMEGHMWSPLGIDAIIPQYPILSLIVSGGHTMLTLQKNETSYKVIGSTVDDAAGEAFDKVAKLLDLPYPGGPVISKLALDGNPNFTFPRPMLTAPNYDFSFSGLKTAVRYFIEDLGKKKITPKIKKDTARAFEDAVIDVLVTKTLKAAGAHKVKTVTLSGGVSANTKLRSTLETACKKVRMSFNTPPLSLCTDNAGMIAIAAYMNLKNGAKPVPAHRVKADSSLEIW